MMRSLFPYTSCSNPTSQSLTSGDSVYDKLGDGWVLRIQTCLEHDTTSSCAPGIKQLEPGVIIVVAPLGYESKWKHLDDANAIAILEVKYR